MKRILNRLRWGFLILAIPVGIGMCWIPWRLDDIHIAWGCPIPMVVWEKAGDSWDDFPFPLAFVMNPAIMLILAGLFFWWVGWKIRRVKSQPSALRDSLGND